MRWQTELQEFLDAYFGDRSLDEAVASMVLVSESAPEYHEQFLAVLDRGIEAALKNDPRVAEIVKQSFARRINNPFEARAFLEELRSKYLVQYQAETGSS